MFRREQLVTLIGQEPVNRALPESVAQDLPWVLEAWLDRRSAERHGKSLGSRAPKVVDLRRLLQRRLGKRAGLSPRHPQDADGVSSPAR